MPPTLSLPPRRAPIVVTSSTPTRIASDTVSNLDNKSLLVFQDIDGSRDDCPSEFEVIENIAKLVIHDVSNLSISVKGGVVSTIEVHNARNLRLRLSYIQADQEPVSSSNGGIKEPPKYGLLSLDPYLHDVRITYDRPELVGSVVLAAPLDQVAREVRKVSLHLSSGASEDGSSIELAGPEGLSTRLQSIGPDENAQIRIDYRNEAWQVAGLERKEKDYPVFGSST